MIKKGIKSWNMADRETEWWRGLARPGDLRNREVSVKVKWRQTAQKEVQFSDSAESRLLKWGYLKIGEKDSKIQAREKISTQENVTSKE